MEWMPEHEVYCTVISSFDLGYSKEVFTEFF